MPEGVFGVLHIDNDQAAEVIRDPRIAAVTLTGSERAGRSIASNAGGQLKKCVMELGGSDAFVVLEDADLEKTVAGAVASRFGNVGQTCIAAKRFVVVESIADEFVEHLVQAASKLTLGDPNDRRPHWPRWRARTCATSCTGRSAPASRRGQAAAGLRTRCLRTPAIRRRSWTG
jgi:succinate-semialdehyde dehydrogenase/glutarate-semialdehyde dehydrogenase